MNVAIMQPYFFPYIGYFQLIHAVDTFVVYDDVHFIKKGWIHRNRILIDGNPHPITLPIQKMSQNRLICDHERSQPDEIVEQQLKLLRHAYHKAPQFEHVFPLLERVIRHPERNVGKYLAYSIEEVARYLGISTTFILSSELNAGVGLKGQARILNICEHLRATHYVNAINGMDLYDTEVFEQAGIDLSFIETEPIIYHQGSCPFQANLSIIDVMMHCPKQEIQLILERYALVSNRQVT
ncbi:MULTISPECIES: WbqC family protein [unclassified Exiguobacterium]|uniref:WbqC family protein n=1 Tax=unclassified Exiguobacterium TaxID=2644629 RepID=UPI001BE97DC2|nr:MULTISPECIES: WbqC family protein [unclassified Exiguobacterium]